MKNQVNWASVNPEVTRFVFDQADKYLSTQLTTGIAADQRATSAAATFSGFAGGILAATLGYYATNPVVPILWAGLVAGLGFLASAGFGFYSARPVDFNYPGNGPEKWFRCLSEPLDESIGVETENYGDAIKENADILADNAKWLTIGFWAASLAPLAGVVTYLIANLFSHG